MGVMTVPGQHPDELREVAIRMTVDLQREPATRSWELRGGSGHRINPRCFASGGSSRQRSTRATDRGVTAVEAQLIRMLEREVRELRRANEIRRAAGSVLSLQRSSHRKLSDHARAGRIYRPAREKSGVEPISRILRNSRMQIAPSNCYATKTRPLLHARSPTSSGWRCQALP